MEKKSMLRGMANVSYWADDVKAARQWDSELFGNTCYIHQKSMNASERYA